MFQDFGDGDNNPFNEPVIQSHGTRVASIMVARPNNRFGMAGICWGCKVMCLKIHNTEKNGILLSAEIEAINYLIKKNVKVSCHSYNGYG